MLVNIYNNFNNKYVSLNVENFTFNDILLIFEEIGDDLKIFDKNNINYNNFNENYENYLFIKSGIFLGDLLNLMDLYNYDENNLIIFEIDDMLYYVPLTINVFIILEGLLSLMYSKNNISVSQRVLITLDKIEENEQNNSR